MEESLYERGKEGTEGRQEGGGRARRIKRSVGGTEGKSPQG